MADTSIKVCVRFRPQNSREKAEGGQVCVVQKGETGLTITTTEGGTKPPQEKDFNFDRVFMMDSAQDTVFNYVAKPVLEDCFAGFNGTIFAYGQTGSGKTHTMMGTGIDDPVGRGIIPRVMFSLFEHISSAPPTTDFVVKVNYVEIYMEKVKDLIDTTKSNLSIREDPKRGIYIQDVTDTYITSPQDAFDVMATGDRNRVVAFTQMNAGSSRSHSIFTLNIEVTDNQKGTINNSKLNLVDLAGSEKIAKTGAEGQQLEEAKKINQSLSALGNVINALTDPNSKHIPYRDSKLTRILQESLGGNAKTTLIVCCSSSSWNDFETVSSLRFGMRAKNIKNKVEANTELSKEQLKKIIRDLEIKIKNYEEYIKYLEGGGAPDPTRKTKGTGSSSQVAADSPSLSEPVPNQAGTVSDGETNVNSATSADGSSIINPNNGNTNGNEQASIAGVSSSGSSASGENISVAGDVNNTNPSESASGVGVSVSDASSGLATTSEKVEPKSNSNENTGENKESISDYIHSLQEKVIKLESTVQSAETELQSYKMNQDDLYAELVSGEEARTQLEKEIAALKSKNDEMAKEKDKMKTLENNYNALKEFYSNITAEHEEETAELANEIDSLRAELKQKRLELRDLNNKLELGTSENKTASASNNQANIMSNEAIDEERASWNVEKIKYEETVKALNGEIKDLKDEIEQLKDNLEEIEQLQQQQIQGKIIGQQDVSVTTLPKNIDVFQSQIASPSSELQRTVTVSNVSQVSTINSNVEVPENTIIGSFETMNISEQSGVRLPQKETLVDGQIMTNLSPSVSPGMVSNTIIHQGELKTSASSPDSTQGSIMKSPLMDNSTVEQQTQNTNFNSSIPQSQQQQQQQFSSIPSTASSGTAEANMEQGLKNDVSISTSNVTSTITPGQIADKNSTSTAPGLTMNVNITEKTPNTPVPDGVKQKTYTTPVSQKELQIEKTIADLKNLNKQLKEQLATSKIESAETIKVLYAKINSKSMENIKLKSLLDENDIEYEEDTGIAGVRRRVMLNNKGQPGANGTQKLTKQEKHEQSSREKQELRKKNMILTKKLNDLSEEYETMLAQYNALRFNYTVEKNKSLKELQRKDMEIEQNSRVLTLREIREGEISKQLNDALEKNALLQKALEEKMHSIGTSGARVIKGGSQMGIRGGSLNGGSGFDMSNNILRGGGSGNENTISGGNNMNSSTNINVSNSISGGSGAPRNNLTVAIPRVQPIIPGGIGGTYGTTSPLSNTKSASYRAFMTKSKMSTFVESSAQSSENNTPVSNVSLPQDNTPVQNRQRRKSISGLRKKPTVQKE